MGWGVTCTSIHILLKSKLEDFFDMEEELSRRSWTRKVLCEVEEIKLGSFGVNIKNRNVL